MARSPNPTSFCDRRVAEKFASYPPLARRTLLRLRQLILDTAAVTPGVGPLTEALKWGEPAYLTEATGSGSTIRIDWKRKSPSDVAMYFHCQTNLVETFRRRFPGTFRFEGRRAIVFDLRDRVPAVPLAACIEMALAYHRRPRAASHSTPTVTARRNRP